MTPAGTHCLAVGAGVPESRTQEKSRMPAIECRIPAIKNGGSVSMPMRMPRYVEPQRTYTAANARTSCDRDACRVKAPVSGMERLRRLGTAEILFGHPRHGLLFASMANDQGDGGDDD